MYRTQLGKFIDCVENGGCPVVSIEDGVNVIKLIDASRDASIKGSKIYL